MNRATEARASSRAEVGAPRAAGWFFAFVLCVVIVANVPAFIHLQAQAGNLRETTEGLLARAPRRGPEFHLKLRERTSLVDIAAMAGPFTRMSAVAYYTRGRYYEIQEALSGHEIVVPMKTALSEVGWRYTALVPLVYEPHEKRLRAGAGASLEASAQGHVQIGRLHFRFLFDPSDEAALVPGERVHLYADRERDGLYFIVAESDIERLAEWLE